MFQNCHKLFLDSCQRVLLSEDSSLFLQEVKQSRDNCRVETTCTPLPITKEPNRLYFPTCIDMPQCVGTCCEISHRCQPRDQVSVKVKVRTNEIY